MTTNAALIQQRLHNQRLVRPGFDQPAEVVAWLGALQGQDYPGAKWSLGLRLVNGTDVQVEQAIADGHVVRTWAMRGTLHLVAAADVRWLVALVAPRIIAGNARRYRELELDEHTLARSSEVIASQLRQPLARKALLAILEQNGISTKGQRAPYLLQRASLDGLIGQGVMQGRESVFFPLPDAKSRAPEDGAAELARRYFASRGPATLKDFIWWSGLAAADARAGLEAVKSALAEMKIEGQSY
ncbi:MAG: winged helix DNA-binding domain-containing protein, partial [Candidatus Methanoperedens sp.]|nr:winged helix DNA-binding domain-containing protein [Candidatus Methanoperedens sp.]